MSSHFAPAPAWQAGTWLNTPRPLSLEALRGRVVVLHAFQMLCPACVSHGLPQATAIHRAFAGSGVAVVGLYSVFEHHAAMNEEALRAFVHEYRLAFPIAIDAPGPTGSIPRTMQAYGLRGTPSLVLIDRQGRIRLNHFGHLDDLRVGALIGGLLAEAPQPQDDDVGPGAPGAGSAGRSPHAGCDDAACAVPQSA